MKVTHICLLLLMLCPVFASTQNIVYSDMAQENTRDMNFEILGKLNGNFLVFKNQQRKYAISVYAPNMDIIEKVPLDFIPDRTFDVDFLLYPGYGYTIFQYQKRNMVFCMAAKFDSAAHIVGEPILLDTTKVNTVSDSKIYSFIYSEDKKKLMVLKVQKENDYFHFATKLYDPQFNLQKASRVDLENDDRRDAYSDFLLDNDGNLVFTKAASTNSRDDLGKLSLIIKAAAEDTFRILPARLNKKFVDELKIKVDNVNKTYLLNSFYYTERRGSIKGIYSAVWKRGEDTALFNNFTELPDSLRQVARSSGSLKTAFDDFFIRNVVLKKDGGFMIISEDYYTQGSGFNNGFNRWDYLYNSPYYSPYYYNYYSPYYGGGYSYYPYGSNFNNRTLRYYYNNILAFNFDAQGQMIWGNVVNKAQYSDQDDYYLSFSNFVLGGAVHFLFNDVQSRFKLLSDNYLLPTGEFKRNPTIKSNESDIQYMPRYAKQTGARQVLIPCSYRDKVFFARIDF